MYKKCICQKLFYKSVFQLPGSARGKLVQMSFIALSNCKSIKNKCYCICNKLNRKEIGNELVFWYPP